MQHNHLLPGLNGLFGSSYIVAILTANGVQGVQKSHLPSLCYICQEMTQCQ
jgi:hypothetical protein